MSASLSDIGYGLIRWAGAAAAKSLPHQAPVAQAQGLRGTLLPLQSEITAMTVRLSMIGNEEIKTATLRISDATGALVDHITEPAAQHQEREEEVRAALGQLRRTRDAADAHLWRRGALRRKITPDALVESPEFQLSGLAARSR